MLSIKYFTVTLAVKRELYQIIEFYCCSTGKINPSWNKLYWYSTLKSQILMMKQILQFPWLDLIFIKTFFWVKKVMSSRQGFFCKSKIKIHNYSNILYINFCQYKIYLFKFVAFGLFLYICTREVYRFHFFIFKSLKLKVLKRFSQKFIISLLKWEGLYCAPVNRALKMQFNEESGSCPPSVILGLWKIFWNLLSCFPGKINTQI